MLGYFLVKLLGKLCEGWEEKKIKLLKLSSLWPSAKFGSGECCHDGWRKEKKFNWDCLDWMEITNWLLMLKNNYFDKLVIC